MDLTRGLKCSTNWFRKWTRAERRLKSKKICGHHIWKSPKQREIVGAGGDAISHMPHARGMGGVGARVERDNEQRARLFGFAIQDDGRSLSMKPKLKVPKRLEYLPSFYFPKRQKVGLFRLHS